MARYGGRIRHRSLGGVAAVLVVTAAVAACSSDAAKEAVIAELAEGTWHCAPDATGAGEDPFTIAITESGFTVELDRAGGTDRKLTGTWSIEGGDLSIGFTGAAANGLEMGVDGFEDLTLESTSFLLDEGGLLGRPMEVMEKDPAAATAPIRMDVAVDGTDAITLTTEYGEPWTCERR